MNEATIRQRLKKPMSFFPFLSLEFIHDDRFMTSMENRNPNTKGNFTGGDMAYIANAAAVVQCASEGLFVQSAAINVECLAQAEGELLLAENQIIHQGKKMIRTRGDVYVRKNGMDTLVAIAQISVALMSNQTQAKQQAHGQISEKEAPEQVV